MSVDNIQWSRERINRNRAPITGSNVMNQQYIQYIKFMEREAVWLKHKERIIRNEVIEWA